MGLKWEELSDRTHCAALPVFGKVLIEGWSDGGWHVYVSVPGLRGTLIAKPFSSLDAAKTAANDLVGCACRAFFKQ